MAVIAGCFGIGFLTLRAIGLGFFPPHPEDRLARSVSPAEADSPLVVVIGTSLTASSIWPKALQTRLENCTGGSVRLENLARNRATSDLGLTRLDEVVSLAPSIVVIEFAMNDAERTIGVSLPESRRRHETIISAIQTRSPETAIYLMTTNTSIGRIRLRRPLLPAYYALYRDLADQFDIGLADLHPRWRAIDAEALPDGLHPTDEAAEAVIVPVLADLIGQTLGQDRNACSGP